MNMWTKPEEQPLEVPPPSDNRDPQTSPAWYAPEVRELQAKFLNVTHVSLERGIPNTQEYGMLELTKLPYLLIGQRQDWY